MIRWIIDIIRDNIRYFPQTFCLAKSELRRGHTSSDLGIFWAVAKPCMYMVMFYFAISFGFKSAKDIPGSVCPYFIWLASGLVQWQFVTDLLVGGASCFQRRRSIIRGMKYPLSTIPTVSVLARCYIYVILIAVLFAIALLMGVKPSIYWLQLPIYCILSILFIYVWVLMTALMNILSADIVEFIKTIRTAFFWLSGILFNIRGRRSLFFALNPISYITEGFRNCFAFHIWIWEEWKYFLCYLFVMFIMLLISFILYRRMEKKMPELL